MQLNYYISPRLEKRGPTISEYSEVYCLVKMSESENIQDVIRRLCQLPSFRYQNKTASCRRSGCSWKLDLQARIVQLISLVILSPLFCSRITSKPQPIPDLRHSMRQTIRGKSIKPPTNQPRLFNDIQNAIGLRLAWILSNSNFFS